MPIFKGVPSGFWPLYVAADDFAGNEIELDGRMLAELNYPYDIEVINSRGNNDTAPPKLLSLVALTPLTVNSTINKTSVLFQMTVQDDFSGVARARLRTNFFGSSSSFDDNDGTTSTSGIPILVNITVEIGQKTPPGNYSLSVELQDRARNFDQLSQLTLASLGFPSTIRVVN
jgi:hypothetical protein